jgi:hypothetical protein
MRPLVPAPLASLSDQLFVADAYEICAPKIPGVTNADEYE